MYKPTELQTLVKALRSREPPVCPRCLEPMTGSPAQQRRDLPYVRDRIWLLCPRCRGSAVLERKEIGPAG